MNTIGLCAYMKLVMGISMCTDWKVKIQLLTEENFTGSITSRSLFSCQYLLYIHSLIGSPWPIIIQATTV